MSYSLTDDYVWKEVGGQIVILRLESGFYWSLNTTASLVWREILNGQSLDEITKKICVEFDVEDEIARGDLEEIVENFKANKMIC